jgi:hypothetical protein
LRNLGRFFETCELKRTVRSSFETSKWKTHQNGVFQKNDFSKIDLNFMSGFSIYNNTVITI